MPEIAQNFGASLLNLLTTIRISDILDMLILAAIFYRVLWFLRRSSSGRVARGVLLLILAMFLSYAFKLYAISFVINKAVEWGIVVLVILFQPEIRRFLETMGGSRIASFLPSFHSSAEKTEIELAIGQIVEACTSMSRDKVGVLIAFERKNLLDDVIKTGTPFDSSVSAELLKNIFWNKAPMHDGALIIRDGRIAGAGCMLPLSSNVNLSRDLGMRHRAGIGLSEHTDAVAVIVSEETGSISAAVGGMLKRHLAPETLEQLLKNELLKEDEQEKASGFSLITGLFGRGKKGRDADV